MAAAPTVILGAGLSGLSVARALLRRRPGAPIVLVDRRTSWERDRTWCFWDTHDLPDAELATARWSAWNTVGHGGAFTQYSRRHPYVHLPADRFYEASLHELSKARNVDLQTDTRVLDVRGSRQRSIVVETSRGELHATAVVDAMGGSGPLLRNRDAGSVELSQRFVGLEVEVEHPIFDPSTATLMDFRV
ncbi:MAG: hypothetical protein JHD16_06690, partial [Solirubrobacteraceae bacterium]|nr:hypothetical protein [Solirubrobacteraceae bacterium]